MIPDFKIEKQPIVGGYGIWPTYVYLDHDDEAFAFEQMLAILLGWADPLEF